MAADRKKSNVRSFLFSFFDFYKGAEIDLTSVAVAYYLMISVFPILFLLANILPYLRIDVEQILLLIKDFFPEKVYPSVSALVVSILTTPSSSWLGISVVTTLWTISKSMDALQKAFNKAYGVEQHRDFIVSRLLGMILGVGLQLIILLGVLMVVFGNSLLQMLERLFPIKDSLFSQVVNQTEPIVYGILFLSLLMFYFFLPNVRITKFRYVLPGAMFVLLVMGTVGQLFGLYIARYTDRLLDFRMVTAVILLVIMLWFIFMAQVLIIGAVLNATVQSQETAEISLRKGDIFSFLNRLKTSFKQKKKT